MKKLSAAERLLEFKFSIKGTAHYKNENFYFLAPAQRN